MTSPKALPSSWVERIFARMTGVYGREFTGQFATGMVNGMDPGIENAKEVWAEELGCLVDRPEAIGWGLSNLPEKVPNAIRFRELCRGAPKPAEPLQLSHQLSPERKAENREQLRKIMAILGVQLSDNGDGLKRPAPLSTHHEIPLSEQD